MEMINFRSYQSSVFITLLKKFASTTVFFIFFFCILIGFFICWIDVSIITGATFMGTLTSTTSLRNHPQPLELPLNCARLEQTQACPQNYPTTIILNPHEQPATACPDYFRWIHEDLRPWKSRGGITKDMVERGKEFAHFRLIILNGRAYVEQYRKPYQTRDVFTVWGILQLLRLYPGKVPHFELMFWCEDHPVVKKRNYQGRNATSPPPVFHYCGHENAFDIVFPDWTFWGWAETNIKPWNSMLQALKKGNKKTKWKNREPYAFWKGNPDVSPSRLDLMKCNVSDKYHWNARLYTQDWNKESQQGYKTSKLEDQCTHRYKIYVEGSAWSVSEKYILACDSMTLLIKPFYYDFFTRSLIPLVHFWPIRPYRKCRDIKFAVEWGNKNPRKAQTIGKGGSKFIEKNLEMKYVYDYMFHLLSEYSKLLKYELKVPEEAVEICSETLACFADGLGKGFMVESMVESPSQTLPCYLPPPFEPLELQSFVEKNKGVDRQVEMWENEHWESFK